MKSGRSAKELPSPCLKVFLLYDDFELARRAKLRLDAAAARCGEVQYQVTPWRSDLLEQPAWADAALAEALDADLMLLALGHTVFLPPALQRWLEVWATCRTVPDAAAGLLVPAKTSHATLLLGSELESFARRHGLTWLAELQSSQRPDPSTASAAMLEDLRLREHGMTPLLRDVLSGPAPYRFFGLNE